MTVPSSWHNSDMLTAAAAGMAENHQFGPESLELDGLGDREAKLGTLARVLQQHVMAKQLTTIFRR
jgi:hypothetical protein